jgi:hypothetical protein
VVRVPPERMPEGRMQFCRQHTPELVWQPERQSHPNRAYSLTDILLCIDDPAQAAARYGRFLGLAPKARDGFYLIELARGRLHLFDPDSLARSTGILAPTTPFMAGFALASADLAATRAVLAERGADAREIASGVIAAKMSENIATTILFTARGAALPWLGV